jgi:hypothetical protein
MPRLAFILSAPAQNDIHTIGLLSGNQGNFSGDQLAGFVPLDVVTAADQTAVAEPIDLSMTDILVAIDQPADSDPTDVIDVGQQINAAIADRVETVDTDSAAAPYVDAPADIVQLVSGFVDAPTQNTPVAAGPNLVTTEANVITAALDNADSAPPADPIDLALLQAGTVPTASDLANEVSSTDQIDPSAVQVPANVADAALSLTVDATAQDTTVATQPNVMATEANAITAALSNTDSASVADSVDPALAQANTEQTATDLLNVVSTSVDPSAAQVVTVPQADPSEMVDAAAQDTPVATQPNVVTTDPNIVTAAPPLGQQTISTITGGTAYVGLSTATTGSVLSTQALDSFFAAPVSYRLSLFGR